MSMAAWCCVLSIWLVQAYFVAELYRGLELLYIIIVLYTVYDGVIWFPQIWKNFDLFVPLPVRLDDPRKTLDGSATFGFLDDPKAHRGSGALPQLEGVFTGQPSWFLPMCGPGGVWARQKG